MGNSLVFMEVVCNYLGRFPALGVFFQNLTFSRNQDL